MILAHRDATTNEEQSLINHSFNVAHLAAKNSSTVNLSDISFLLGLLHDLGKADRNFQEKIKTKPHKKVTHSSAGAKYFFELILNNKNLLKNISKDKHSLFYEFLEVIIYIITAHHGIYDIWPIQDNSNRMESRLKYDSEGDYYYEEDVIPFARELEEKLQHENRIDFSQLILNAFDEYIDMDEKLSPEDDKEKAFYSSMKIRLLLSVLKNADIQDTINAYETVFKPFDEQSINKKKRQYLTEIEKVYQSFSKPTTRINAIRTKLGEEGIERGKGDSPGIYQLNLPTGAGKTLISLRYGMHQLNSQSKSRFIYITPFLSVLEQNAKEIKEILKDEDIIEHHSNVVRDSEAKKEGTEDFGTREKAFEDYLIDTWDGPVILSTMVQFFQTLFKGKSSHIRRFSSLIDAVIVLDEVQSLPINVTHLFNLTMNFVSQVMGANIVMCTATQPTYDSEYITHKLKYGGKDEEPVNIAHLTDEERQVFDRTEVHKLKDNEISSVEEISDEVLRYPSESTLVILNTKNAVKEVYTALSECTDRQIYYLTTNLCPRHRQEIIAEMKEYLKNDEPIICISTQLIEAGVDIDFNRLIRSYAGIDSIIQSMGRCNREGDQISKGIVKLAKVSKQLENITRIEGINEKTNVTSYILKRAASPVNVVKLNDAFYASYYANNQQKMDYPIKKKGKELPSGFELLSTNLTLKSTSPFTKLNQSFQTAAQHINLIENDTTGVIVHYKESKDMIEELITLIHQFESTYDGQKMKEIKRLLQKLQLYTVNLYLTHRNKNAVMSYLDGMINILPENYYDEDEGVIEEIEPLVF